MRHIQKYINTTNGGIIRNMAGKIKKRDGTGFLSKVFKKKKKSDTTDDFLPMEEEIAGDIKKTEPIVLKEIDTGKKSALGDVEPELRLWLSNGRIIKNLPELAAAMKNMKKSVFRTHAKGSKNDFSSWIADIIKNRELAAKIKKLKTSGAMYAELKKFEKAERAKEKNEKEQKTRAKKEKEAMQAKKTIQQLMPVVKKTGALTLKQQEDALLEKEKQLNEEERKLNERKIELSKKRIALLKERGELEKEKFEKFLKKKTKTYEELPFSEEEAPEPMAEQKNKSEIIGAIQKTRRLLEEGNTEAAKKSFEELQTSLRAAYMPAEEKRKLQYETLELEADIKLASL